MPYCRFCNAGCIGPAHLQRAVLVTTISMATDLFCDLLLRIAQQESLPHRIGYARHPISFEVAGPFTQQTSLEWTPHRRGINRIRGDAHQRMKSKNIVGNSKLEEAHLKSGFVLRQFLQLGSKSCIHRLNRILVYCPDAYQ